MILFGVVGILIGLALLASVGATGTPAPRSSSGVYRKTGSGYSGQALLVGLAFIAGGGALAYGARTPWSRAAKARGSYVELADTYVEWLDPEGGTRRLEFSEIVDIYETDTSIALGARGQGKSLTIPMEYEDYEEMTQAIKKAAGRG